MSLWHTVLIVGNIACLIDSINEKNTFRKACHLIALFLCVLALCDRVYK